jgi:hypothetical protein
MPRVLQGFICVRVRVSILNNSLKPGVLQGLWTSRDPLREILITFDAYLDDQPANSPKSSGGSSGGGGDGHSKGITAERLLRVCRRYSVGVSEAEVAAMVREADRDGSGCVSREEYVAIMKNAGWF